MRVIRKEKASQSASNSRMGCDEGEVSEAEILGMLKNVAEEVGSRKGGDLKQAVRGKWDSSKGNKGSEGNCSVGAKGDWRREREKGCQTAPVEPSVTPVATS